MFFLICFHLQQAFMLKRAAEEPLGHAAAIITDVLENAETNEVINASQKRALLQEMALRLTWKRNLPSSTTNQPSLASHCLIEVLKCVFTCQILWMKKRVTCGSRKKENGTWFQEFWLFSTCCAIKSCVELIQSLLNYLSSFFPRMSFLFYIHAILKLY